MDMDDTGEAREFLQFEITMSTDPHGEIREFKKGEFWFGGDMLFVSHSGEVDGERRLEIFNTRFINSVSLRYGV